MLTQDIQFELIWPPVTVTGSTSGGLRALSTSKWTLSVR